MAESTFKGCTMCPADETFLQLLRGVPIARHLCAKGLYCKKSRASYMVLYLYNKNTNRVQIHRNSTYTGFWVKAGKNSFKGYHCNQFFEENLNAVW